MPTYEYQCSACGHKFEEFQSMSAKPIRKCPSCGQNKVRRLISGGAGFIFKGSGFYITDYRSDSYKADAKNDTAAGKAPTGGTSGESKSSEPSSGSSPATTAAPPAAPPTKVSPTASESKGSKKSSGKSGAA
jgi:putative FmdB family regulatory protein